MKNGIFEENEMQVNDFLGSGNLVRYVAEHSRMLLSHLLSKLF